MRCSHFLELYSDFRDGGVTAPELRRRLTHHANRCARCRRYHETVSLGIDLLHAHHQDIVPSERFRVELRAKLRRPVERRTTRIATWSGRMAGTAIVAGVIWFNFARPEVIEEPAPLAVRPAPPPTQTTVRTGYPFADFADITPAVLRAGADNAGAIRPIIVRTGGFNSPVSTVRTDLRP